jgi:hypothetical protein
VGGRGHVGDRRRRHGGDASRRTYGPGTRDAYEEGRERLELAPERLLFTALAANDLASARTASG